MCNTFAACLCYQSDAKTKAAFGKYLKRALTTTSASAASRAKKRKLRKVFLGACATDSSFALVEGYL